MKKVLGIFRGFPGLGRVVSGVSILEQLQNKYNYQIEIITYLQGNKYLEGRGYTHLQDANSLDICSIGLLPTNKMGEYIHERVTKLCPDIVLVDGEPLIIQSLRISHPALKIVVLLNPADVDNPHNNIEAMEYFNTLYSLADLAIVHGLRKAKQTFKYRDYLSISTILRYEIFQIKNKPSNNIYCVLGGGTVNVGHQFAESTIHMAMLCQKVAKVLPNYVMNIMCSSKNIYNTINENKLPKNVLLHNRILSAHEYYSDACLIITRSGRNTLSELAYLGIPAISFVTGDSYRRIEQVQNIENLNNSNIQYIPTDLSIEDFKVAIERMIHLGKQNNNFEAGNQFCINKILNL